MSKSFKEWARGLKMPHTLVIVGGLVALVLVLSWLVPSGQFLRVEKLVDGKAVSGGVPVPGSFHLITKSFLGLKHLLMAPIRGFEEGKTLIAFLLIIGGSFNILQETGAVEFGIRRLVRTISSRAALEWMLIPVLMIVFSLAGAIFGMAEELIPFIVIFIPMARALGYDSIVGTAIPFLGSAAGFACAFFNPFTVGVAQGIAGVPVYSGLKYRISAWAVVTAVVIAFVMVYARKVKRNPEASVVYDLDQERERVEHHPAANERWDLRHVLALLVLGATMVLLVFGVLKFKWFMADIAALFLAIGIVIGFVGGLGPSAIAKSFVAGAKDMVGVVMIVACARALLVIANEAQIMDTLLHAGSRVVSVLPKGITAQVMFLVQCAINFFIHSGTAQAALTMPIMAPLADLVGITRQTTVYAFELCELAVPILPTSAVTMGVLGAAKIPWERWAKWFLPLLCILVVMAMLLLVPPTLFFHWGPI